MTGRAISGLWTQARRTLPALSFGSGAVDGTLFSRKARWRRRRRSRESLQIYGLAVLAVSGVVTGAFIASWLGSLSGAGQRDLFTTAVADAFPEAERTRIETVFGEIPGLGEVPVRATVYMPHVLLRPVDGGDDPFLKLGAEFGVQEQALSGPELGRRIGRIMQTALGEEVPHCQTYKIGEPHTDQSLRALHIYPNPGC